MSHLRRKPVVPKNNFNNDRFFDKFLLPEEDESPIHSPLSNSPPSNSSINDWYDGPINNDNDWCPPRKSFNRKIMNDSRKKKAYSPTPFRTFTFDMMTTGLLIYQIFDDPFKYPNLYLPDIPLMRILFYTIVEAESERQIRQFRVQVLPKKEKKNARTRVSLDEFDPPKNQ